MLSFFVFSLVLLQDRFQHVFDIVFALILVFDFYVCLRFMIKHAKFIKMAEEGVGTEKHSKSLQEENIVTTTAEQLEMY